MRSYFMSKLTQSLLQNQKRFWSTVSFISTILLVCLFSNKNRFHTSFYISPLDGRITTLPVNSFSERVEVESNLVKLEEPVISLRGGGINSSTIASVGKPLSTTRGKELAEYKQKLKLSKRQKEIAVGVMLGDGSLQTQDKGKSYRLKFQGSQNHLEYGKALYKEFEPFCLSELALFDRTNENNNVVKSWSFQTLSHEEFCSIANLFFDTSFQNARNHPKKVITPNLVENHLTPTGLAHWFMDDGSKMDHTKNEGKGFHLHTQGFEEEEVESLCNGLKNSYGFKCWKVKNKGKHIVAISGESYQQFVDLIKSDLLPCMQYKLPSERRKR